MALKIVNIIQGNFNRLFNINLSIAHEREGRACKRCVMSHVGGKYTGKCQKDAGGCGCPIKSKTNLPNEKCPLSPPIWANDWINTDRLDQVNEKHQFILPPEAP